MKPKQTVKITRPGDLLVLANGSRYNPVNLGYVGTAQSRHDTSRVNLLGVFCGFKASYVLTTMKRLSVDCEPTTVIVNWTGIPFRTHTVIGELGTISLPCRYVNGLEIPGYEDMSINSAVTQQSVVRAWAKMSSPDTDLGVMAGELGETISLIRKPLHGLTHLLQQFWRSTGVRRKRKSLRTAKEVLDASSEQWLEYRYGIVPLVSDVQGLLDLATTRLMKIDGGLHRSRATSKLITTTDLGETTTSSNALWPDGVPILRTVYRYSRVKTQKTATTVVYIDRTWQKTAKELAVLGLSPAQVPSLLWELTPWSFVVDWFVGVGDWLRAWEPKPWAKVLGAYTSHKITNEIDGICVRADVVPQGTIYGSLSDVYIRSDQLTRITSPALTATPSVNPRFFTIKRKIDALSLAWQNAPRAFKSKDTLKLTGVKAKPFVLRF